jgi:hypothetical protein
MIEKRLPHSYSPAAKEQLFCRQACGGFLKNAPVEETAGVRRPLQQVA